MDSPDINKELDALVNLIDEPDEEIYKKIRNRIITYGNLAIPHLEKAWENNLQPIAQKRIEILLHKIQFESLCEELNNWYSLGGTNLLMGYLLVCKYQYPNLDEQKIRKELEKIKQDIWLELNSGLTAFEKVRVVNKIFFTENKFQIEKTDFHSPQYLYLNNVVETRKGNHLSLAMTYLIILNLVELPVFGVNLPDHFVLAYMDEHSRMPGMPLSEAEVLTYIDPYSKGSFFSRVEIDLFLKQRKIKSQYTYYRPCKNVEIIRRLLNELIASYEKAGNKIRSSEIELILKIFN